MVTQRSYPQPQNTYSIYTAQNQPLPNNPQEFGQAPLTTPTGVADFSFRYSLPETSAAMSPFVSPRAQMPNFGASVQQLSYQQQPRYGSQNYAQAQFSDVQASSMPRLAQPIPVNRHSNAIDQLQSNTTNPFTGMSNTEQRNNLSSENRQRPPTVREDYYQYSQQIQLPDQSMRAPPHSQERYNMAMSSSANLLPPLHSTVSNVQPLLATAPTYNTYIPPDNRLPHQPVPLNNPYDAQDKTTGYPPSAVDFDGRRSLHEPG